MNTLLSMTQTVNALNITLRNKLTYHIWSIG